LEFDMAAFEDLAWWIKQDRAQAQAFVDTWTWDDHANICFDEILTNKNGLQTQQSIALITGFWNRLTRLFIIRTTAPPKSLKNGQFGHRR